jgi:hypothetical protein
MFSIILLVCVLSRCLGAPICMFVVSRNQFSSQVHMIPLPKKHILNVKKISNKIFTFTYPQSRAFVKFR